MKKGIILNLNKFKLLDYVTRNKILIFLCALYILGILISTILLTENNQIFNNAKVFLEEYILLYKTSNFLNNFFMTFLRYAAILVLYFMFGTSMFAIALIPFLILWQGLWFGAVVMQLYKIYGIYGIAFNAIILIPPTVIFVLCCFFAAKYSLNFSISIAKLSLPKAKPATLQDNFNKYSSVYLIIVCVIIVCSLIEILLNLLFLKFFNF